MRIRQYEGGETFSLTEHEIDGGVSMDDVCDVEGHFREFTIAVSARPPEPNTDEADAVVDIPDAPVVTGGIEAVPA